MNTTNPTTANEFQLHTALCSVVRPFRSGSAYGVARVESHDGSRTVVHGLHERSKQWANVQEVEEELNRAHLIALGLAFAGDTNRQVVRFVLRNAYELAPAALDTAVVLVCDALGLDVEGTGHEWDRTPPALRSLLRVASLHATAEEFIVFVDSLRAAALLNE